jgi:hypothetical protein
MTKEQANYWSPVNLRKEWRLEFGSSMTLMETRCISSLSDRELGPYAKMEPKPKQLVEAQGLTMEV